MRRLSISRLASVLRALDFGSAVHAPAFALPAPRQNTVRASSAHAATAPALRLCAVPYSHRRACDTFHLPLPGTDKPYLGGSVAPHLGAEFGSPTGLPFFSQLPRHAERFDHPISFFYYCLLRCFPGPVRCTDPTIAWPPSFTLTYLLLPDDSIFPRYRFSPSI